MQPQQSVTPRRYVAVTGLGTALVVVPGYVNRHSATPYDPEKSILLCSIALLVIAGLIVEGFSRAGEMNLTHRWRQPLFIGALLFATALAVATVTSLAPHVSWWGDYVRRDGSLTLLAAMTSFAAIASSADGDLVDFVVDATLIGSVLPALSACLQIRSEPDVRAAGTAGNPIFLAAYLIMVWPLTLARLTTTLKRHTIIGALLTAGCGGLLVCQTVAIVRTGARGAWVGWAVGTGLMILLLMRVSIRRRQALWAVTLGLLMIAGICFALAIRYLPASRVSSIAAVSTGTARIRIAIWNEAVSVIKATPLRFLTGFGPETTSFVVERYQTPELNWLEQNYARVDRLHNIWLDTLFGTGLLGAAALTMVWLAVFAAAYAVLGIVRENTKHIFALSWLVSGVSGMFLAKAVLREPGWMAIGFSAGILLALFISCLVTDGHQPRSSDERRDADWLTIALSASLLAHFVEIQFAFDTVLTTMLFWTEAGTVFLLLQPDVTRRISSTNCSRGPIAVLSLSVGVVLVGLNEFGPLAVTRVADLHLMHLLAPLPVLIAIGIAMRRGINSEVSPKCIAAAGAFVGMLAVVEFRGLEASRARTDDNDATYFEERQDWVSARARYSRAVAADPAESYHLIRMNLVMINEASASADQSAAEELLRGALSIAQRARLIEPANPDGLVAIARTELAWSELAGDATAKAHHAQAAERLYAECAERRPSDPRVWAEWARLDFDTANYASALSKVEHALSLYDDTGELERFKEQILLQLRNGGPSMRPVSPQRQP